MKQKLFTFVFVLMALTGSMSAAIHVNDNSVADWQTLDQSKVAVAVVPNYPYFDGLHEIKVYCDGMYINYMLRFDPAQMTSHTTYGDVLQIFINADNNDTTGGYWDMFESPNNGNTDIMLEGALWDDEGNEVSYDPAVAQWDGEIGGDGWFWEQIYTSGHVGESQFVGNNILEGRIRMHMIPFTFAEDSFSIGFVLSQQWEPIGLLPQGDRPDDDHIGRAEKLQVSIDPQYQYTANIHVNNSDAGHAMYDIFKGMVLDTIVATAYPNEGYHFVEWADGNTENSRTIVLTQDTTLTAVFEQDESPEDPQEENISIIYIDNEMENLGGQEITLHFPEAPEIEGFTFVGWRPVAEIIEQSIVIQAVYTANEPTSAPAVYTNPANKAQKLIRNGNAYILTDDKIYSITGQKVK